MCKFFTVMLDLVKSIWYNFHREIYTIGGLIIRKLHTERKEWLEFQNKKRQAKISKLNKIKERTKLRNKKQGKVNKIYHKNQFVATAPEVFSIINNPEETICYFNKIIQEISKRKFSQTFYFDLSKVTFLTIDAIMYIIAILRNIKGRAVYKYHFQGNQPINEEAKRLLKESGFFNYVRSAETKIIPNSSKIQIVSGNLVDSKVVRIICDFVNDVCMTKRRFTAPLYASLIELMTNTIQHAYKGKDILFVNHWYVFVEDQDNKITLIFLDTGEGIPSTIYKKLSERIPLFTTNSDSKLICSALKGEHRSETRSSNRGTGLPLVSDFCIKGVFQNLQIYSGSGCCKVLQDINNPYVLIDVGNRIFGTLFSWEINKDDIMKEYKI